MKDGTAVTANKEITGPYRRNGRTHFLCQLPLMPTICPARFILRERK